jgi:hypothetical protein
MSSCRPHSLRLPLPRDWKLALLWIKIIAFTLFHAFAILHGKLFRLGKVTMQELRKQIYRSLLCGSPIPFFSG